MNATIDDLPSLKNPETGRLAGLVLLLVAIFTVVAMAHHPSGHETPGEGVRMTLGGFIHATMIVLLAANLWGLTVFSVRRGFGGLMLAGLLAYAMSFVANLNAATINGFIVPAVVAHVDHAASGDLFATLWLSNQAMAKLGIYAASAAFLFWSAALLRKATTSNLVVGALGILIGLGPSLALYSGAIQLNVDGALIAYGMHAVWTGAVGVQMLRRSL